MKVGYEVRSIPAEKLLHLCTTVLEKIGLEQEHAIIIGNDLVETDLRGVYSHGVMRFPILVERIEKGANEINPVIQVVQDRKATAVVDGGNGMGQVVSQKAMQVAIEKAKSYGISGVGIRNSNHNGTEANWAMMALEHEMIGFCATTGGCNIMAPWGGADPMLGNNPFSFAIPTGDETGFPIVFDLACSIVARGWIVLAMKQNEKLPEGWALDRNGNPTRDAKDGYEGSVLPIGTYKGYGLSLMVGILCSLLSGAAIGDEVTDFYHHFDRGQNVGHFMGAIDISYFVEVDEFKHRIDKLYGFLKTSRLRPGFEKIYVPGELEDETYKVNSKEGIPVPTNVIKELQEVAARYEVKF